MFHNITEININQLNSMLYVDGFDFYLFILYDFIMWLIYVSEKTCNMYSTDRSFLHF